jgi:hypothetical protein
LSKEPELVPKKRVLTDWLASYLELTKDTEPPELFRLWTGISVVAAALQRKCKLKKGFQTFYPNMYIVLLGPPASRKGTALGQGYFFMEELKLPVASDSSSRAALIRRIKKAKKKITDTETGEDITHSSITIFSPEFTVLIGYQDVQFLTVLVDWFDCGKGKEGVWENDTIARGEEKITGIWVNILAGTTAQLLRQALPTIGIGGGFSSRVLFINEFKGERKALKDMTEAEAQLTQDLIEDLHQIHALNGAFQLTPECQRTFDQWYVNDCEEEVCLNQDKFAGYIGRRATHCYKLMMIVNASRTNTMLIETEDFKRALNLLKEVETRMESTFSGFGKFEYAEELGLVLTLLKRKKKITRSEIYKLCANDAPPQVLDGIIETLRVMNKARTTSDGNETIITLVEGTKDGK